MVLFPFGKEAWSPIVVVVAEVRQGMLVINRRGKDEEKEEEKDEENENDEEIHCMFHYLYLSGKVWKNIRFNKSGITNKSFF